MNKKPKIIVVDKSSMSVSWVRAILANEFEVLGVSTRPEFSSALAKEKPDIVLIDVRAPVLGDDFVATQICTPSSPLRPTVLLFSSLSREELANRAKQCGADGFLQKDGNGEAFVQQIKTANALRRSGSSPTVGDKAQHGSAKGKRVILVVGPAPWLNRPLVLARFDFTMQTAKTANEALQQAAVVRPSLIVVGEDLPDRGVEQYLRMVRSDPQLRDVSILTLHEGLNEQRALALRNAGANVVFFPPIDWNAVNEKIAVLVNVAERRRARLIVRIRVDVVSAQGCTEIGHSLNISSSGMLIEAGEWILGCQRMQLHFFVPGYPEPIQNQAEIVRVHAKLPDRVAVGVRYIQISDRDRDAIERFVGGGNDNL